jgi:hypothetical protein
MEFHDKLKKKPNKQPKTKGGVVETITKTNIFYSKLLLFLDISYFDFHYI